jgi:hypothetical protein
VNFIAATLPGDGYDRVTAVCFSSIRHPRLDPVIHAKALDSRVKPGDDDDGGG